MKILLAVDDDALSHEAARVVADWFPPQASVVALHVGPVNQLPHAVSAPVPLGGGTYPVYAAPALKAQQAEILLRARETAQRAATIADGAVRTEQGDPAGTIVDVAAEIDADLIVVGTGDRSWVSRLVDPSVSAGVIRNAPCSVLLVRQDERVDDR